MFKREPKVPLRFHEEQAEKWSQERKQLLDRIQHPEVRQVERDPNYEPPEPSTDDAELACVGTIIDGAPWRDNGRD